MSLELRRKEYLIYVEDRLHGVSALFVVDFQSLKSLVHDKMIVIISFADHSMIASEHERYFGWYQYILPLSQICIV